MNFRQWDGERLNKTFKDDCVVRSISIAMDMSYKTVFLEIMQLAIEMGAYPSYEKVWIKYLEQKGWVKNAPPRNSTGKMIKLAEWTNPPNRAVVRNSGHLTAVVSGCVIDTWDCRYRPVNSFWTFNNDK